MAAVRLLPVLAAALAVSACGSPGGTVALVGATNVAVNNAQTRQIPVVAVGVPEHRAFSGSSSLSSIPPSRVRVLPFHDGRKDVATEGTATAAFGVRTGNIRFEPGPAFLIGQAVSAEIRAAGHAAADGAEGPRIAGSVLRFDVHTDTTLLYWDVIGNLAVSLQFLGAQEINSGATLDYHVRCAERTYSGPSEAVIAGVMRKCIGDFADQMRKDGRAAAALRAAGAGR